MFAEGWKVAKRAPIGSLLTVGVAALSIAIVWEASISAAGTDKAAGFILAGISAFAVLYSMSCLGNARRFKREGRSFLQYLFLAGLVVSEGYIMLAEGAWFKEHFMTSAMRSQVEMIGANGDLALIEKAQLTLDSLKSRHFRSEETINADIDAELTRAIDLGHGSKASLSKMTKDCTDRASSWSDQCSEVYKFRRELAESRQAKTDFEQAKTTIGTRTLDAGKVSISANAGAMFLSEVSPFSISIANANIVKILAGLALIACLRIGIAPVLIEPRPDTPKPDSFLVGAANDARFEPDKKPDRLALVGRDPEPDPTTPTPRPRKKERTGEPSALPGVLLGIRRAETAARATALSEAILGDVEAFYEQRTKPDRTAVKWHATPAGEFRKAYLEWCDQNNFRPVGDGIFRRESLRFVKKSGKIGGNFRYQGRSIVTALAA
jgi:hypothetical protein